MGKIILLNGVGSCGKTSIARAVQELSNDPWVTFGIDSFIEMSRRDLPGVKQECYTCVIGENERGPLLKVEITDYGKKLFSAMSDFALLLARSGVNVIIDEILFGNDQLKKYIEKLSNLTVYFVGIKCDLQTLQQREKLREDRVAGLANDQFDKIHSGAREYDFTIDTTNLSADETAKHLLTFIENNGNPIGFTKMKNILP